MKQLFAIAAIALIAAAPINWASRARQIPSGAIVLGNPAAKVKFVEYLSYTCSHCAEFTAEAKLPLKRDYVAKGQVSVEVRNAVRDGYDFTAAMLARCGGPSRFFGNTEAIIASQGTWLSKAAAFDAANSEKMSKLPIDQRLLLMARGVGLDGVMKARGFTPAQINACLINKADQKAVTAMTNEAWNDRKISGTPAFLINGQTVTAAGHWNAVEPELKSALAAQ
jgi:protein-disulfide isomerase